MSRTLQSGMKRGWSLSHYLLPNSLNRSKEVTYPMFNITKEIIIFSSQQCHVTDRLTRTRTMATSSPCWYMKQLESQHSKLCHEFVIKGWECWNISKFKFARKMVSNYSPKSLVALKKMYASDRKWPCNNTRKLHRREWSVIKKTFGS